MHKAPADTANDDESLAAAVNAAREGDESGFQLLYRTLQPGILRYLRTLVGEEAEDIASETWVQVVRGLESFSGNADDFRGWTTTIARNRAIDHLRRVRRRPVADSPVEELVITRPAAENTAEAVMASIGTDEALALIGRLPRDQAEALLLRIVLDLDVESTARILGKRPGAVRSAAHRGLRRLAKVVGGPRAPCPAGHGSKRRGASGGAGPAVTTGPGGSDRRPRSARDKGPGSSSNSANENRTARTGGLRYGSTPPGDTGSGPPATAPRDKAPLPKTPPQSVTETGAGTLKDVR